LEPVGSYGTTIIFNSRTYGSNPPSLVVTSSTCGANAHCTSTGCVCNDGYTGDGVTCTSIDYCASSPCKNGGSCANSGTL